MTALPVEPWVGLPLAGASVLDVVRAERDALDTFLAQPPATLDKAAVMLAQASLPVACMGVGKSGLIAAKIAATLASLGTAAFAVAPGDAAHGDLGAVMPGSLVLMLSNSGTTAELLRLIPALRARGCQMIGLIGRAVSPLGLAMDLLVPVPTLGEGDHLGLAPTASTTLALAVGDGLAVAASVLRGFGQQDFLRCHPAGQLGQRALPITALMRVGDRLPIVPPDAPLAEVAGVISAGLIGAAAVCGAGVLLGLVVDGDIRRRVMARADLYAEMASDVMRADPLTLLPDATIGDALDLMRKAGGVAVLPVADDAGRLLGMVHSVDLVQAL